MQYWNSLLTEKSWQQLQFLRKQRIKFTLIGGWAVWLWTKAHKSKDIDIMVELHELGRLRQLFDLKKNPRLRKYEFALEEIDVDVYVPHYSRLAMPVEKVLQETAKIEGLSVARPEVLLILKQGAELARRESEKGLKDRIDIMDLLLNAGIDFKKYKQLLEENNCQLLRKRLIEIVQGFRETKYVDLNPRELKKRKQQLLLKIKES